MRTVYDTNGNDVTSTVSAFLSANRTLYMCDLMMISSWVWWGAPNGNPQYMNFYFSFGDFPVQVSQVQTGPNTLTALTTWGTSLPATFIPMAIDRDKFEYGIGFSSQTVDITWYCGNSLVPIPLQQSQLYTSATPYGPLSIAVSPGGKIRLDWLGGYALVDTSLVLVDGFGLRVTGGFSYAGAILGAFVDSNDAPIQLESFTPLTTPRQAFLIGNSRSLSVPPNAANLLVWSSSGNTLIQSGMHMLGVWGDGVQPNGHFPTYQQAFSSGMFDECPVNIYRAYFNGDPKQGGTLLGTTLKFRGFIRDAESAADHVKLTVSSLLDIFQEVQVPTQLIQPGNRTTPYVPSGITYTAGSLDLVHSTQSVLQFGTSSAPIADHALTDAYLITGVVSSWTPMNGQPQPVFLRIRENVTTGGVLFVYLYEPTVIPLENLGMFWGGAGLSGSWVQQSGNIGILLQKPTANSYGAKGFPYVPTPEIGI